MKMKLIQKTILIFVLFILISCEEKKIIWYEINIIQTAKLNNEAGGNLDEGLKQLINYSIDSSNYSIVYMPRVLIRRMDCNPEKLDSFVVPLNPLNKWRKSMNMIASTNLIEDYDENIPKLTTPKILVEKGDKEISINEVETMFPSAIKILINENLDSSLFIAKKEIVNRLMSNKRKVDLIFYYEEKKKTLNDNQDKILPGLIENIQVSKNKLKSKDKGNRTDIYYLEQAKEYNTKLIEIKNQVPTKYTNDYNSLTYSVNKLNNPNISNTEKDKLLIEIINKLLDLIEKIQTTAQSTKSANTSSQLNPIAEKYYSEAKSYENQARKLSDKKQDYKEKKQLIHKALLNYDNARKNGKDCNSEMISLKNEFREYFNQ
jgi:hypothetical protein